MSQLTNTSRAVTKEGSINPGRVFTFYSFKGGVGRSMALANTAGLLAKWGQRILIIDWDLEAPGIEKYFEPWLSDSRKSIPGLVDLINSFSDKAPIDWRECLLRARIPQGETLAILHAGRDSDEYTAQLRRIDWERLFANQKFGLFLEHLRTEWITEYDFVFIDSRTGFTDIGGICTIHLPDVLVGLFTASEQSLTGIRDVFQRASQAHSQLPVDRHRLIIVPIPARDESNTEYELSSQWRHKFASQLAEFYSGWRPKDETVERILDHLKIPYFAYWSFGERLPVLEEDPDNPKTLAFSYQLIARLFLGNLDWQEVKRGTRAVEAEAAHKLAIEGLALQAAKVREEAQREAAERDQAARQAEMETLRQRREGFMETLLKPALKRHRRNSFWSLMGIGMTGFLLFGLFMSLVETIQNPLELNHVVPLLPVGILSGWGLYACIKSRRHNPRVVNKLENEKVQYEAGVGRYNGLTPEKALSEFVHTVQAILIQKWSQPLTEASSSQGSTQWAKPDSVDSPPKASNTIDVFLSYEHSALTSGWLREFLPLFASWLKEGIGCEPHVFDHERLPELQSLPPETLEALTSARCLTPILTPSYFRSEYCLMELRKFIEIKRPILPIMLHPLVRWPEEFQDMAKLQMADFTEFVYIGEGFTKTEQYVEFQRKLRMFAQEVTKSLIQEEIPS